MEIPEEPASSLISPIRVRSRFHATGLLYHDLDRTAEGLFFGDLKPGSISQNRVAIRIADGEILDYLNAGARLRTQRVKVELSPL